MFKIKKFFKTLKSIFHCITGILIGIFASIKILIFPVISLLLFLAFIIYETIEEEPEYETTKNFVELFVGIFLGRLIYIIFSLLHIFSLFSWFPLF
jgi:hypothetical protein